MLIRKLAVEDTATYRTFRMKALEESPFAFSDSPEDESRRPTAYFHEFMGFKNEHFTLGAFGADGTLAAVATLKRDSREKARHKCMIHTMYVAAEYRGQGIAGRLLKALLDEARKLEGLEQIHLWVLDPAQSAATRLYQKTGFLTGS